MQGDGAVASRSSQKVLLTYQADMAGMATDCAPGKPSSAICQHGGVRQLLLHGAAPLYPPSFRVFRLSKSLNPYSCRPSVTGEPLHARHEK